MSRGPKGSRLAQPTLRYMGLIGGLLTLVSCAPGSSAPRPTLHDITVLDGNNSALYSYYYGEPSQIALGNRTYELRPVGADDEERTNPLAVPGALRVGDLAYFKQEVRAPELPLFTVTRRAYTSDLQVRGLGRTEELVYLNNGRWFDLASSLDGNFNAEVVPRERLSGLAGLGQLTNSEARVWSAYFESLEVPIVIAVLPLSNTPARNAEDLSGYQTTALMVQRGVPIQGQENLQARTDIRWDYIGLGQKAAGGDALEFAIATDNQVYLSLWNKAHARELDIPKQPIVNFGRQSVFAVFLGDKELEGYDIEVVDVLLEGNEVYADVAIRDPSTSTVQNAGEVSPWVMARVFRPDIRVVWVRDVRTGELIGVARK